MFLLDRVSFTSCRRLLFIDPTRADQFCSKKLFFKEINGFLAEIQDRKTPAAKVLPSHQYRCENVIREVNEMGCLLNFNTTF